MGGQLHVLVVFSQGRITGLVGPRAGLYMVKVKVELSLCFN
jgi:hypothetical protein